MKKAVLLLLLVCCNVFCMNDLRVGFIEATSPLMIDQVRNFEISLYQALVNAEAMSSSRHVLENVLRFFAKNKIAIEEDESLYKSVCEYIMRAGEAFQDDKTKQGKIRSRVVNMLSELAKRKDGVDVFKKFYDLFSGKYLWITPENPKFAKYAMLAYALKSESLSMYDVNLLDGLSMSNNLSDEEVDKEVDNMIHSVVEKAPFLVGAYYDVRPENDTLILGTEQKKRITDFLQERLKNEEATESAEIAFKEVIEGLTVGESI